MTRWLGLSLVGLPLGCADGEPTIELRCADAVSTRRAFFGDTHVHTALSLDANLQGTRLRPADAYRFAQGDPVGIQPYTETGEATRTMQLERPLDFAMVSDHAAFLGTVGVCSDPSSPAYEHPDCATFRDQPNLAFIMINGGLANPPSRAAYPALCGADARDCQGAGMDAWQEIRDAADAAYDRSDACTFTTFIGYEWSGNPDALNLHRNVMFASEHVPEWPQSYFDSPRVEDLWTSLEQSCRLDEGCDVLAIPHNSNLSSGQMFLPMEDVSSERAGSQARVEPVVEIYQHKGDSECLPGSWAADELCDFEKLPYDDLAGANLGIPGTPQSLDFVREALAEGLKFEASGRANPYRFGIIASTDTHLATPGAVQEVGYAGHGGAGRNNRDEVPVGLPDDPTFSPGGLAVVWAEENSREAIFRAMKRREVYGTSGPRLQLRFFGGRSGWDDICGDEALAERGYEEGVPMGGTLPDGEGPPTFVVAAESDLGSEARGVVPLERLQLVRGWLEDGVPRVEVVDIAGEPMASEPLDTTSCEPTRQGATSLCATFTDTSFTGDEPAFWYVRAVETPTCRWTRQQCVDEGISCPTEDAAWAHCCEPEVPDMVQERAWSSPIFYRPNP